VRLRKDSQKESNILKMNKISIIAGMTQERVIGKDGMLPWNIPEDLRNFRKYTSGNVVVMGRKTYESIISYLGKPLPNRENIVVSRTMEVKEGIHVCRSFEEAMDTAQGFGKEVFIIGGTSLFVKGLEVADRLVLSWIKKDYPGDAYFPSFDVTKWKVVDTGVVHDDGF